MPDRPESAVQTHPSLKFSDLVVPRVLGRMVCPIDTSLLCGLCGNCVCLIDCICCALGRSPRLANLLGIWQRPTSHASTSPTAAPRSSSA